MFTSRCNAATMQARLNRCGSSSRKSIVQSRCSCQARQLHAVNRLSLHSRAVWTAAEPDETAQSSQFEGLLPEEDVEVPGTYFDAMNSQTKLGKAVRAAVEELEHLGDLEVEVLQQCDDLLKKLGMKGSIFGGTVSGQVREPVQSSDTSSGGSSSSTSTS
ncbi:hypothetical protein COO60DRAFT_1700912 [Scenedesmus sp. NREL 46B-D3]|nr:hypothetical protein COO60DRAFT_1700912 [Scenedesmus sp. NREL 46B-D3]